MILRNRLLLLGLTTLLTLSVALPLLAARQPSNTYTVRIACVAATAKPPTPGHARTAKQIMADQILPKEGAFFALDLSTPVRFRKQMESVSRDYDYELVVSGSMVCGNAALCSLTVPPNPQDSTKAQMTCQVTLTPTSSAVGFALNALEISSIPPGEKTSMAHSLKATRTFTLGRTYVLGGWSTTRDGKITNNLIVVSVQAGG